MKLIMLLGVLNLVEEMVNFFSGWILSLGNSCLRLLWHAVHFFVSIWYFTLGLVSSVESFLVALGLFKRYRDLDVSKVKYLAVAIDSEEAVQTNKVIDLLSWLTKIGFKNICLYDMQGVLKKKKDVLELWLKRGAPNDTTSEQKIQLEFVAFSDGKQAVSKAATRLMNKYFCNDDDQRKLTESDMIDALAEIGYSKPDPDLMLIYGSARCHLGFPAWRIRYTEIVNMGPLKAMKFGALIKAIQRFSEVQQNYGK